MNLKVYQLFLLAILGGGLLGVSYPFTGGLFPLVFVAFIPFLIINYQLNLEKIKGRIFIRFLCNYLGFVIFNLIATWWIYYASESGAIMAVLAWMRAGTFVLKLREVSFLGQSRKYLPAS